MSTPNGELCGLYKCWPRTKNSLECTFHHIDDKWNNEPFPKVWSMENQ